MEKEVQKTVCCLGGDADTVGDKSDNYLQNDRLVTTPSASLADPLLVEIIANAFFIIEFPL